MRESQKTIADWANETFGQDLTDARVASRANLEMAELISAVSGHAAAGDILTECADVTIVLMRFAEHLGGDLFDAVDRKMRINRERSWAPDESGHGYHTHHAAPDR